MIYDIATPVNNSSMVKGFSRSKERRSDGEMQAAAPAVLPSKGLKTVAIYIFCSTCKESFKVRDEYAGKRGVCPKCGSVIQIASALSETQRGLPRPATKSQKEEANRLGIQFDERITYLDLKKKIEAAKVAGKRNDSDRD